MPLPTIIDISRPLAPDTAVFPGDVPFSRLWTLQMEAGDSCNVSEIRGSSHAGTHVDLPYHFGFEVEEPSLEAFVGPAVVIEVNDWAALSDLTIPMSRRVLFKTRNSRTESTRFDAEFDCLPPSATDWLIENRAVLVGVDGPSVDPVDSKELDNHKRLASAGIAILENLDLTRAEPGEYDLIALPLKVPGADATWVRAVLLKS